MEEEMKMISLKKKLFKKAIIGTITDGQYNDDLPRSSFIKAIIRFREEGGTVFLRKSSVEKDYLEWEILFLEILDELGKKVKPDILGKPKTIVTPEMRRGAQRRDFHHRRALGKNYI